MREIASVGVHISASVTRARGEAVARGWDRSPEVPGITAWLRGFVMTTIVLLDGL
jgi:hypothetical protein